MIIAIDETGRFELNNSNEDIALVTLVTLPDRSLDCFLKYLCTLKLGNFKSSNLSFEMRSNLVDYISSDPNIKFSTFLLDSKQSSKEDVAIYRRNFLNKFDENMKIIPKSNSKLWKDANLFRNQFNNLSNVDFIKFNTITNIYINWCEDWLFDYEDLDMITDEWNLLHLIDTQNKPEKFKRLVFDYISLTTNSRNPNFSIKVPQNFTDEHPFIRKYDIGVGLNIRKFFENVEIAREEDFPALILPDLIGNTIYKSVELRSDTKWINILKKLANNRSVTVLNKNPYVFYVITGHNPTSLKENISVKLSEHHKLIRVKE